MASENKKRKGKNSHLDGGAEKQFGIKLKRLFYFCKQDRIKNKKETESVMKEGDEK